ncbi:ImmA/IrrE family metallo-endopeptidase [Paenibacillus oceani]|uniref:ImmA/IrrE family metallo-endopeptidase n=1 Tax=Paenibacillus oceani TaxID=2772510 RepID=A0A927CC06_9BACL|nr:ImmA/IrrE family metallo-endopeptidase [Paenibacillus oceani]MBD2863481.1 ImmA/IrrE family metallo-endopeptidase [Paenibacillus oceani]
MTTAKYITQERMELLTERILTDYGFDPHQKRVQNVPIEEIVEFHFDLHICWEPIDHFDPDGIVMAAILPTERRIVLNETHRELFDSKIGTYHFTLAHELGHWVLHSSGTPYRLRLRDTGPTGRSGSLNTDGALHETATARLEPVRPYYCRSTSRKPPEEVQADLFAECLLMPRPMMERTVGQLRKMGKIHLSHLYGLAECFRVSISALSVRLTRLQLLNIDADGNVRRPDADRNTHEQLTLDL